MHDDSLCAMIKMAPGTRKCGWYQRVLGSADWDLALGVHEEDGAGDPGQTQTWWVSLDGKHLWSWKCWERRMALSDHQCISTCLRRSDQECWLDPRYRLFVFESPSRKLIAGRQLSAARRKKSFDYSSNVHVCCYITSLQNQETVNITLTRLQSRFSRTCSNSNIHKHGRDFP